MNKKFKRRLIISVISLAMGLSVLYCYASICAGRSLAQAFQMPAIFGGCN